MQQVKTTEVLTLEEVSDFLQLPEDVVLRQVLQGNLPGRKIENTWRFLKAAIEDWLRSKSSRDILIQQIGVFAEDDSLAELRSSIYQARGRSEVDETPNILDEWH
jgi:predicted DNA-binding transcriptional regulator AlpA